MAKPCKPATEWDSKRWRTIGKRGWAKTGGWRGPSPIPGGCGGCSPKTKIKGKLLTFTNLPPSGIQNFSGPSANEGGQKLGGTGGRSPHDGGHWGVSPTKLGDSDQPPVTTPRAGLKALANHQQTRVGKNWERPCPIRGGLGGEHCPFHTLRHLICLLCSLPMAICRRPPGFRAVFGQTGLI